jgi:hypothetical protein
MAAAADEDESTLALWGKATTEETRRKAKGDGRSRARGERNEKGLGCRARLRRRLRPTKGISNSVIKSLVLSKFAKKILITGSNSLPKWVIKIECRVSWIFRSPPMASSLSSSITRSPRQFRRLLAPASRFRLVLPFPLPHASWLYTFFTHVLKIAEAPPSPPRSTTKSPSPSMFVVRFVFTNVDYRCKQGQQSLHVQGVACLQICSCSHRVPGAVVSGGLLPGADLPPSGSGGRQQQFFFTGENVVNVDQPFSVMLSSPEKQANLFTCNVR